MGIGLIPEDRKTQGVFLNHSIAWNIAINAIKNMANGAFVNEAKVKKASEDYREKFAIKTPNLEQKVKNLSGGNQQKVILARWMATNPKVLILDEPTRGIDVGAKAEIQRLMMEMCGEGVSVIFISSELDEIIRCSNRIIIMRDREKVGEVDGETCTQDQILSIIAEGSTAAGGEAS